MNDVKFVRITTPDLIPVQYIEQIKERDYPVERFYDYNRLIETDPLNYLFAITDSKNAVKGVLWASIDLFYNVFYVNILSVDKSLQKDNIIDKAVEVLKKRAKHLKLDNKLIWATKRWKAFEGKGFKQSEVKIMEVVWDI